jgi:oligopeptide/dipeptide ABC transporter ATP-binding protein
MISVPIISADSLHVAYPAREGWRSVLRPALRGVSLDVHEGETLAVVGESGSGKSTLGKALLRLVPTTAGHVLFEGTDITRVADRDLSPFRLAAQMIFQDPYLSLNPRKTVRAILGDALRRAGPAGPERVGELLASVGLDPAMADRYPRAFSGGQRQRIGIARALATSPRLIIADEPVSALDVSVRAQVVNLLAEVKRRDRLTLVFISHDLGVVRHVADRIAVMYFGGIVEVADNCTFYAAPAHPYSAALLAAAPAPEPALARAALSATLSGEIPNPARPPSGCPFHTRCPRAQDLCRVDPPLLRDAGQGRIAACHFPLPVPALEPA